MTQMLDTTQLNTFAIVAESDSFNNAATRLGVTQSAVSQSIKLLESQLGAMLVIRRTKPLQLTPAGMALKRKTDLILNELCTVQATVREAVDKGTAQCRLGLITSLSEVFGSPLIVWLKNKSETLTLRSGLTSWLTESFLRREIDILIATDPLTEVENLERFQLLRDPMLLAIATRQLPAKNYDMQTLADGLPLIKFGRATHIGTYSEVILRRMGVLAHTHYETDDTHTMLNLVEGGHGWGLLSALCLAQSRYQLKGISALELDSSRHSRSIYLLARKGELGSIPELTAKAILDIFFHQVHPQLQSAAPWLTRDAFLIA